MSMGGKTKKKKPVIRPVRSGFTRKGADFPIELWERFQALGSKQQRTMAWMLNRAVEHYVKEAEIYAKGWEEEGRVWDAPIDTEWAIRP